MKIEDQKINYMHLRLIDSLVYPKGGITISYKFYEEENAVIVRYVVCSFKDGYNKKVGRDLLQSNPTGMFCFGISELMEYYSYYINPYSIDKEYRKSLINYSENNFKLNNIFSMHTIEEYICNYIRNCGNRWVDKLYYYSSKNNFIIRRNWRA